MNGSTKGPQAALIAENFPTRLRYSGASLGYQLTAIIAGGPAPLVSTWLLKTAGSSAAISLYVIVLGLISLAGTAMLKDRTEAPLE
ncbi:MAG: Metabolite transporter [Hydrogenibacillus schlegelii]|uniref:Metabolite transporter n=1 Tax=Hydrogenibacillus schlegelii TaxID=1484 RepID=A0A2T5G7U3_HYDSH|nr:hypothetical protein [Hydrogenibacillus schlegelii]PTQ52261.1 MAG: Metabolite transporter [Hydrogenibacillus schlegelii]